MSSKARRGRSNQPRGAHTGSPPATAGNTYPARSAKSAPVQHSAAPMPAWVLFAGILGVLALAFVGILLFAPQVLNLGPQAAPDYSPDGRISFVRRTPDGKADLFVTNPDGTRQEQVTKDLPIEGTNSWSPDGKRMLVQAGVNGISTVVRMDIGPDNKSSNAVQLTADVKADSAFPAWSPGGNMIVFQSKRDGNNTQIYVMDADGNNKRRVSSGKDFAGHPAWSPDGKSIVYRSGASQDPGTPKELFVVPIEGGTPKQITTRGKDLSNPHWSPDGKHIAFIENVTDRNSIIYVTNADGSDLKVLVDQGANKYPQFSPDGQLIAYYSVAPPNGSDIFTVPIGGGATANLTHLSSDDYQPAWSPDGKRLAWASRINGNYKIVVGAADGSNEKTITTGEGDDGQPSWGAVVKQSPK